MSLQYSNGPLINRLFTPASRQDIVTNVTAALLDAGWLTISGTPNGGTDVVQESAANNQGNKIRVRSTTGATSAAFSLKHPLGTTIDSSQIYLAVAATYRIVANKFWFACFQTSATNRATVRNQVFAGTIWVPTWLTIFPSDAAGFIHGTGNTDTDGSGRNGWRVQLDSLVSGAGAAHTIFGSVLNDSSTAGGRAWIPVWQGGGNTSDEGYRWEDGTVPIYEPLFIGASGAAVGNEGKLKGQLYDALVMNGSYAGESLISFDNHIWLAITDAATAGARATATLFIAIPNVPRTATDALTI